MVELDFIANPYSKLIFLKEEQQPNQEINSEPAGDCQDRMEVFCEKNVLGKEDEKCGIPFVKETCQKTCKAC